MKRKFLSGLFLLLLAGCSSLPAPGPVAAGGHHLDVPFFAQQAYHCGPAALAGVLNFNGVTITPDELVNQVYLPERRGSLTLEMQAAPRRFAQLVYPLAPGLDALLREVRAGNPVLVLQNLSFSWWPQWHYALVIGFEDGARELILHSGSTADYHMSTSLFMRTWRRADYWARVIVPPSRLPATATPDGVLAAAHDLEQVGEVVAASAVFQRALQRWPQYAGLWFALGNTAMSAGRAPEAAAHYQRSVDADPRFAQAWNNLAFALQELGCEDAASRAVSRAVNLRPDEPVYADSRREIKEGITGAQCQLAPDSLIEALR